MEVTGWQQGVKRKRTVQTYRFVEKEFSVTRLIVYFLTVAAGEISIAPEARGRLTKTCILHARKNSSQGQKNIRRKINNTRGGTCMA